MARGRPKKPEKEKGKRRAIVAAGKMSGRSIKYIAKDAGISEREAYRVAAEPETRLIIQTMMEPYRKQLERLAERAIAAVDVALQANKDDVADHPTRLRAIGRFKQLAEMAAGQRSEDHAGGEQIITWEQFVVLYRKRNEGAAAQELQP